MNDNLKAFLSMVAHSELGDRILDQSNDGYDVLVGSTPNHVVLFNSFADHPRKVVDLGRGRFSSAAGRYQILKRYFDFYKSLLKLKDFSPASQDAIAVQMIKECKAISDVEAGNFDVAVDKCKSRWASLPGAGYEDQHMNDLADLRDAYVKAGGSLA